MSIFGDTTAETGVSASWANYKFGAEYTLAEAGVVSKLTIYLANAGTGHAAFYMKPVVYADSSGAPGALLATGSPVLVADSAAVARYDMPLAAPLSVAAADYWLGAIFDANAAGSQLRCVTTGGTMYYNADTYSDGATDPFGTPSTTAYKMAIYATYVTAGTATLYSDHVDGYVRSQNAAYATARSGGTLLASGAATIAIGQSYAASVYTDYEGFIQWDLTGIPAGANVTNPVLSLYIDTDSSTTDFNIEARTDDFGATLETGDWVAGASLSGLTLLASITTAGISTSAYTPLTSQAALATAVAAACGGYLRILFDSDRHVAGTTPSGNEYVLAKSNDSGAGFQPRLVFGWSTSQLQVGGTWHPVTATQIQVGGAWHAVTHEQVNVGGAWHTVF